MLFFLKKNGSAKVGRMPESYQAMFRGTPGVVHMTKEVVEFVYFNHGNKAFEVIPMERKALVPPQIPTPQPILGMHVQITPLQQSASVQPVITSANTITHTRSSPQQPINQGVIRQLATQPQQMGKGFVFSCFVSLAEEKV
jgi:hypothetical protein